MSTSRLETQDSIPKDVTESIGIEQDNNGNSSTVGLPKRRVSFADVKKVKEFQHNALDGTEWNSSYAALVSSSSDSSCTTLDAGLESSHQERKQRILLERSQTKNNCLVFQDKEDETEPNFMQVFLNGHSSTQNKSCIESNEERSDTKFVNDMDITTSTALHNMNNSVTEKEISVKLDRLKSIDIASDIEQVMTARVQGDKMLISDMDMTSIVSQDETRFVSDMEITRTVPQNKTRFVSDMEITRTVPQDKMRFVSDMEITRTVPQDKTRFDSDMEITRTVPQDKMRFVSDMEITRTVSQDKTRFDSDMEITRTVLQDKTRFDSDMEMTGVVAQDKIRLFSGMEMTCTIPHDKAKSDSGTEIAHVVALDKTRFVSDMEITDTIPQGRLGSIPNVKVKGIVAVEQNKRLELSDLVSETSCHVSLVEQFDRVPQNSKFESGENAATAKSSELPSSVGFVNASQTLSDKDYSNVEAAGIVPDCLANNMEFASCQRKALVSLSENSVAVCANNFSDDLSKAAIADNIACSKKIIVLDLDEKPPNVKRKSILSTSSKYDGRRKSIGSEERTVHFKLDSLITQSDTPKVVTETHKTVTNKIILSGVDDSDQIREHHEREEINLPFSIDKMKHLATVAHDNCGDLSAEHNRSVAYINNEEQASYNNRSVPHINSEEQVSNMNMSVVHSNVTEQSADNNRLMPSLSSVDELADKCRSQALSNRCSEAADSNRSAEYSCIGSDAFGGKRPVEHLDSSYVVHDKMFVMSDSSAPLDIKLLRIQDKSSVPETSLPVKDFSVECHNAINDNSLKKNSSVSADIINENLDVFPIKQEKLDEIGDLLDNVTVQLVDSDDSVLTSPQNDDSRGTSAKSIANATLLASVSPVVNEKNNSMVCHEKSVIFDALNHCKAVSDALMAVVNSEFDTSVGRVNELLQEIDSSLSLSEDCTDMNAMNKVNEKDAEKGTDLCSAESPNFNAEQDFSANITEALKNNNSNFVTVIQGKLSNEQPAHLLTATSELNYTCLERQIQTSESRNIADVSCNTNETATEIIPYDDCSPEHNEKSAFLETSNQSRKILMDTSEKVENTKSVFGLVEDKDLNITCSGRKSANRTLNPKIDTAVAGKVHHSRQLCKVCSSVDQLVMLEDRGVTLVLQRSNNFAQLRVVQNKLVVQLSLISSSDGHLSIRQASWEPDPHKLHRKYIRVAVHVFSKSLKESCDVLRGERLCDLRNTSAFLLPIINAYHAINALAAEINELAWNYAVRFRDDGVVVLLKPERSTQRLLVKLTCLLRVDSGAAALDYSLRCVPRTLLGCLRETDLESVMKEVANGANKLTRTVAAAMSVISRHTTDRSF